MSHRQNNAMGHQVPQPATVTMDMPAFCFDVIIASLNKHSIPKVPPTIPDKNFPIFVTWKKGHHRHLRGCIGTFSKSISLHETLIDYTQTSAFRDSRFEPISLHEVPHLHCSVSLLINFEPANDYNDWVIGVHGIRIDFSDPVSRNRMLSAVYLPEVAREQGWNHVETLDNLMRKGGFKSEITEEDRLAVSVERFQSEKKTISYDEYMAYKRAKGRDDEQTTASGYNLRNGFFHSCLP